jgi:hypothetical protein
MRKIIKNRSAARFSLFIGKTHFVFIAIHSEANEAMEGMISGVGGRKINKISC